MDALHCIVAAQCSVNEPCLLYTSDAADDLTRVDLGGRRIIKKRKYRKNIGKIDSPSGKFAERAK